MKRRKGKKRTHETNEAWKRRPTTIHRCCVQKWKERERTRTREDRRKKKCPNSHTHTHTYVERMKLGYDVTNCKYLRNIRNKHRVQQQILRQRNENWKQQHHGICSVWGRWRGEPIDLKIGKMCQLRFVCRCVTRKTVEKAAEKNEFCFRCWIRTLGNISVCIQRIQSVPHYECIDLCIFFGFLSFLMHFYDGKISPTRTYIHACVRKDQWNCVELHLSFAICHHKNRTSPNDFNTNNKTNYYWKILSMVGAVICQHIRSTLHIAAQTDYITSNVYTRNEPWSTTTIWIINLIIIVVSNHIRGRRTERVRDWWREKTAELNTKYVACAHFDDDCLAVGYIRSQLSMNQIGDGDMKKKKKMGKTKAKADDKMFTNDWVVTINLCKMYFCVWCVVWFWKQIETNWLLFQNSNSKFSSRNKHPNTMESIQLCVRWRIDRRQSLYSQNNKSFSNNFDCFVPILMNVRYTTRMKFECFQHKCVLVAADGLTEGENKTIE